MKVLLEQTFPPLQSDVLELILRTYRISLRTEQLSRDEEKALDDIKTGKTRMIKQSGEEFLQELHEMIDEE